MARIEILRTPGVNGRKRTSVYRGKGTAFTDRTVKNGKRYRYEIIAADVAGNVAAHDGHGAPARRRCTAPAAGTIVKRAPVVLRWEPVSGARFYNVQLFRNGVKVLSVWPKRPRC